MSVLLAHLETHQMCLICKLILQCAQPVELVSGDNVLTRRISCTCRGHQNNFKHSPFASV